MVSETLKQNFQLTVTRIRWHFIAMLLIPVCVCLGLIYGLQWLDPPEWLVWLIIFLGLMLMAVLIIYLVRVYLHVPCHIEINSDDVKLNALRFHPFLIGTRKLPRKWIQDVYLNNDILSDRIYVVIRTGRYSFWFLGLNSNKRDNRELELFFNALNTGSPERSGGSG